MVMKKRLAVCIAASLVMQAAVMPAALANGVKDLYADSFGVRVTFSGGITDADIAGYELEGDGKSIASFAGTDGDTVNIIPDEELKTDVIYTLKIAGETRQFKIKNLFFEDFDGFADGKIAADISETNGYGKYALKLGESGEAFYKNGSLAFTDAVFSVTELENKINSGNVTVSADVEGYGKKYLNNKGSQMAANAGVVQVNMSTRGQSADSANESYAVRWANTKGYIGKVDGSAKFTAAEYKSYSSESTKYDFSVLTNEAVTLGDDFTYSTESAKRKAAIRADGNKITAFIDGESFLTLSDDAYSDGHIHLSADTKTLAKIDNLRVTYCTEDVREPEVGEIKALGLDGDFEKLKLSFDKSLYGITDFSKITVTADGEPVNADISADADDEKVLNIVPEGYRSQVTYKVSVPSGFGTKTLYTAENFEFEKMVEPEYITVTETVMTLKGITVDFNRDITYINDFDSIKVYENGTEISRTVSVSGSKLTVVPENMALENSYKIEIPKGFGNENIFLKDDYSYEETLEKTPLETVKIGGGDDFVYIDFDADLTGVADFSGIKVYKEDIAQNVTCSVSKNRLTVKIADFEPDTEYELFVAKGLQTDTASLKSNILKKFQLRTVVTEDFENEVPGAGVSLGSKGNVKPQIIEYDEGKHGIISWGGAVSVIAPEIVNAEDYVLTYDLSFYMASFNNDDKKYDAPVPYDSWGYNSDRVNWTVNGYQFYLHRVGYTGQVVADEKATAIGNPNRSYDAWQFGDAYYDENTDTYYRYKEGDRFPDKLIKDKGVEYSQRPTPPMYNIKWVKNNADMRVYRNGTEIMSNIIEGEPAYTTGYVVIRAAGTTMILLDNIVARKFEVKETDGVFCGALTAQNADGGELSAASAIKGGFMAKNYTGEAKPIVAAVVAYKANSLMQKVKVIDLGILEPGEVRDVTYDLDGLADTKEVTAILWDSADNFATYDYSVFGG